MSKVENTIKSIFFVSSAAFGAASAINPYLAIPCALTGLAGNYSDMLSVPIEHFGPHKNGIEKQYLDRLCKICDKALKQVVKESENEYNSYNATQRAILTELSEETAFPSDISQLIRKTESYQLRYATQKEAEMIIKRFNTYFQYEVAQDEILCRYYTYTNGFYTLEHIKAVRAIIEDDSTLLKDMSRRMDHIQSQTGSVYTFVDNLKNSFNSLMIYLTFVGMPTFIFLMGCIFLSYEIDLNSLLYVAIAFGVSEYLYLILSRYDYVIDFNNITKYQRYVKKIIWSYLIYVTMVYGIILLISRALSLAVINHEYGYIVLLLLVMAGSITNILTKSSKKYTNDLNMLTP